MISLAKYDDAICFLWNYQQIGEDEDTTKNYTAQEFIDWLVNFVQWFKLIDWLNLKTRSSKRLYQSNKNRVHTLVIQKSKNMFNHIVNILKNERKKSTSIVVEISWN